MWRNRAQDFVVLNVVQRIRIGRRALEPLEPVHTGMCADSCIALFGATEHEGLDLRSLIAIIAPEHTLVRTSVLSRFEKDY